MRNPILHEALRAYCSDAAMTLGLETAQGAELPFELVETPGRTRGRVPLYCYRPLTRVFLDERLELLRSLPSYAPAVHALEHNPGLESYLLERGVRRIPPRPRDRAEDALTLLLDGLFDGRSEFTFERDRFDPIYAQLERALYEGRCEAVVLTRLSGLELAPDTGELALGNGLTLIRPEALSDAPVEAVRGDEAPVDLLVVLRVEDDRGKSPPIPLARTRFRALLTALRLYEGGSYALGPVLWARRDNGAWRTLPLGTSGSSARRATQIAAEQEDELRAFCSLVQRRTPVHGELAWALRRFEMGCERLSAAEALTDHLLALRALLEPEGPASGRLAQRLAMICATPEGRATLAGQVARTVALERAIIAGSASAGSETEAVAAELAEHLRAILRDVLCGHLDEDLVAVADDLLSDAVEEPADEPLPAPVGAEESWPDAAPDTLG